MSKATMQGSMAEPISDWESFFIKDSMYIGENDISRIFSYGLNSSPHNLLMLHYNMRSLTKNFGRLEEMLSLFPHMPDIVTISETKLNAKANLSSVQLPHYSFCHSPSRTLAGGVGIYINNELDYKIRDDLKFVEEDNENIWIEILKTNSTVNLNLQYLNNIIIGVIYRHPTSFIKNFISYFESTLQTLQNPSLPFYITGDININLLNQSNVNISLYNNLISSYNAHNIVTKPSRITSNSATLIDHFYTSEVESCSNCYIIKSDLTDHFPLAVNIHHKSRKKQKPVALVRSLKNFDRDQFCKDVKASLENIDFSKSVNELINMLLHAIHTAMNQHMPLCKLSRKDAKLRQKPWLTKGLLKSIKTKNNMFVALCKVKFRDQELLQKYKNYRNYLNHAKYSAKLEYYKKLFDNNKNDSSKTWKLINEIIHHKKNNTKFPNCIEYNNKPITNLEDVSNIFNNYFINIGSNLANSIPDHTNLISTFLHNRNKHSIFLKDADPEEILQVISTLNPKKAVGYDGISSKTLQTLGHIITPIISKIFNKSIQQGIFPDKLKIAKVIPIHKGGKTEVINNYRPISILTSLSKVFEKLINNRLNNFFKKLNVISDYQFGFREGISTTLALTDICDQFQNNLDDGKITCGVFMDLAKAFDTVNHSILLRKLEHYGIRGNALYLLESYLENRVQFVEIDNNISSRKKLICGVPQGSVLGPTLFLLYINDIQNVSNFDVRLFADDTLLYLSNKNSQELEYKITVELKKVQKWLDANKLTINVSKTKYIIISPKGKGNHIYKIKYKESLLCRTESHKYLGITIDEKLSWKPHLTVIASKLAKLCGLLYKLRPFLTKQLLMRVYYTLIYPNLLYGITCWGGCSKTVLQPLQIIHNRILRCINKLRMREIHVTELYILSNLLKITDIYILEICKLMYKYKHNLLPNIFTNMFIKINCIHSHITRSAIKNDYYMQRKQKCVGQRTLQYRGAKIWNEIPNSIKSSYHIHGFTKLLKSHLIEKYKKI